MHNKKVGNDFEEVLCELLAANGYWAHNMAQKRNGQPADVIAVKDNRAVLIDCKVCSTKVGFDLNRIEENQKLSMELWRDCGNGSGWFACLMPDGMIYMLDIVTLLRLRKVKSAITLREIRELGTEFTRWVVTQW